MHLGKFIIERRGKMKLLDYSDICKFYIECYGNYQDEYKKIVENYIQYYHLRAKRCKHTYYILNIFKFLTLAIIPVVQVADSDNTFIWIATLGASICLFVESVLELLRVKDKWILYRKTDNVLISEQRMYVTGIGKYEDGIANEKFMTFVYSIEALISNEARIWSDTVRGKGNESENNRN